MATKTLVAVEKFSIAVKVVPKVLGSAVEPGAERSHSAEIVQQTTGSLPGTWAVSPLGILEEFLLRSVEQVRKVPTV
jgi:hypothetical protein